jgi:hypothetical protein
MNQTFDDILLFSLDPSGRATEVTARGFEFTDEIAPLFEGSKVLKPVPVMVEGEYHIFDQASRAWKKVTISADDVAGYLQNTPRDVAINYEHKREGAPKGWLRLKDTGRVGMLQTKNGLKAALFAAIELFEGAAQDVKRGLFRDVSIELKPVSREILGTALTGYPIMRDVQFYSNDIAPGEPGESVAGDEVPSEANPAASPSDGDAPVVLEAAFAQPPHSPDQETPMTEQEKQAVLAEALQAFGLRPEDLSALPEALALMRRQEAELKFAHAREHVKQLSQDPAGNLRLAPGALDAAAQLYSFCQEHESVHFSLGEQQLTPAQLFDQLLAGIQAVQVFGAVADELTGAPVADLTGGPATPDDAPGDKQTVVSLVSRMKSQMKAQGLL